MTEQKCLQKLEYDLRFVAEPPVVTAGTALSATPLVQLKGTITETRQCADAGAVEALAGQPSFLTITHPTNNNIPQVEWDCPDPDSLGDDGNNLLKAFWNDRVKSIFQTGCRTPIGGISLEGLTIKATCYYDRGPCPTTVSGSSGEDFLINQIEAKLGPGIFEDDDFTCDYEGPAKSLPQQLFGPNSRYPGVTWTPGSDIPFGHLPANPCDIPDDYEFDCCLFCFIAEKIADAKLSNAIGNIVVNALGTIITGGTLGLTDLISAIRAIRTGGTIPGSAAKTLEKAIVEGYNEYLECLSESLEV